MPDVEVSVGPAVVIDVNAVVSSGGGGGGGGVTDHGALTGLADDDHSQYALADGSRGTFEVAGTVATHSADTTSVHGIANTADLVLTSDSRLSDARTPTAHAASHTSGGGDALTLAQSQVTNLTTDLAARVPTTRTITAGTGLTGGGDLSANRTLTVAYGTTGATACVGNDSRLSDARTPTSHTHIPGEVTGFDEQVRDVMGVALVAGSNVTITPNDGADTITIAATGGGGGGGLTDAQVRTRAFLRC